MGLEPSGGDSGSTSGTSGGGGGGGGGSSGGGGGGESSEQARRFKAPAEQKDFDGAVQALLQSGLVVDTGYVDDQRNTDNAWVESRVVHFHCPRELGEVLPLPQPGGELGAATRELRSQLRVKLGGRLGGRLGAEAVSRQSLAASTAEVHVCWLDADRAIEPRYAEMHGRAWVERALAAHARVAEAGGGSEASHIRMEGMKRHTNPTLVLTLTLTPTITRTRARTRARHGAVHARLQG